MKLLRKAAFVFGISLLAANTQAGRWITRDPIEHMERDPQLVFLSYDVSRQQNLNLYQFVQNDSVNKIDPFGLMDAYPAGYFFYYQNGVPVTTGGIYPDSFIGPLPLRADGLPSYRESEAMALADRRGLQPSLLGEMLIPTGVGALARSSTALKCIPTAANKTLETTAHGAERIAGAAATRGGILGEAEIQAVRQGGRLMTQADGATVRILENTPGRFNVVVEGQRGIITTFQNLSQNSLDRLGRNYGWK
jgi:hypothetical protein